MSDILGTPEGVVECLYAAISFQPGQKPNYNLVHSLFHPGAHVSPPASDTGGALKAMSVEEFIEYFDNRIADIIPTGGREEQIRCRTETFHKVAHVFSSYRFMLEGNEESIARGVNSFQLVYENGRWWIVSLIWDRAELGEEIELFNL